MHECRVLRRLKARQRADRILYLLSGIQYPQERRDEMENKNWILSDIATWMCIFFILFFKASKNSFSFWNSMENSNFFSIHSQYFCLYVEALNAHISYFVSYVSKLYVYRVQSTTIWERNNNQFLLLMCWSRKKCEMRNDLANLKFWNSAIMNHDECWAELYSDFGLNRFYPGIGWIGWLVESVQLGPILNTRKIENWAEMEPISRTMVACEFQVLNKHTSHRSQVVCSEQYTTLYSVIRHVYISNFFFRFPLNNFSSYDL